MDGYIQAKLVNWRTINIALLTDIPHPEYVNIILYKQNKIVKKETMNNFKLVNGAYLFDLKLDSDFDLGASYRLIVGSIEAIYINTNGAVDFPSFDEKYAYDGDDLGSVYHQDYTSFAVWAPLANMVLLKLIDQNNQVKCHVMERSQKGVFRIRIEGDILNYKYHYIVHNNGVISEANDPYGKEVSLNSEYSLVVDINRLLEIQNVVPKNKINSYVDAVIYETHIRDISEHKNSSIKYKGKYLGLAEEGAKTIKNHPAGLDYIKYLNVTHVQLQPILDFFSYDDLDTSFWYNWGYDTISFFALEGSYALYPEQGMSRMFEFKQMVNQLHKNDLRVNIDVVYNHIYMYENSDLEKIVPHYYFRKKKNLELSNASGCGTDFASERKMARKIIVDSVKYLFRYYDIDGLRFDLMGLLDIKTMNQAYEEAKKIKEDIMFYGEGWNMGEELQPLERANKSNAHLLKQFAFFNDTYRDIVKGPSFGGGLKEKGYICGNTDYVYGLDYCFHASILPLSYKPFFESANQSLNYLECHDNNTLFDKLMISNFEDDEKTILQKINFANAVLLLSFGIPFVHMGQEIGLSKEGLDNTYQTLHINNLNYDLLDERFDMVNRFSFLNTLRKRLHYCHLYSFEQIKDYFEISHWENGAYVLKAHDQNVFADEKQFIMMFNPTNQRLSFELDAYYTDVEGEIMHNNMHIKNGFLSGNQIILLYLKK